MNTQILGKQRQLTQNKELSASFKVTSNLAHGLTRERVQIQNDLQKISAGKEQLEALKNMKKSSEPILTVEEKASRINKAEIKGTGFQMTMVCSEKGRSMLEKQRDSRRQRHIAALNESHKYIDQFYENFCEKKNEIRKKSTRFVEASDLEVTEIMQGLSDELLLANQIDYVNGIWEQVNSFREARKADSDQLRANFDGLVDFQKRGSGGFLNKLREDLINIAFMLEPEVDQLLIDYKVQDERRYEAEHSECDQFFEQVIANDNAVFDEHFAVWTEKLARFKKLHQEDAIERFLVRMNSEEMVNPQSRVQLFEELKEEQMTLYRQRMQLIQEIDSERPNDFSKESIQAKEDKLRQFTDESGIIFDRIVDQIAKDLESHSKKIDSVEADLLDMLTHNGAALEEGQTYESVVNEQVRPTCDRRKLEAKTLVTNSIKYMDDTDYKMSEICTNIVTFFRGFSKRMDNQKAKIKSAEVNFQVGLAQCGDHHDEIAAGQEDELAVKVKEMTQAIHHVQLNEKLEECFTILDAIQKTYRNYNTEYIKILDAEPDKMDANYDDFEAEMLGQFQIYKEARREEIQEKLRLETEAKQEKLKKEALEKWEAEQRAQEEEAAKQKAADGKAAGKDKGKPAAAAKKGKEAEPQIDVETLEVPTPTDFTSEMENKYIRERPLAEIAEKLKQPSEEDEEDGKKDEQNGVDGADQNNPTTSKGSLGVAGQEGGEKNSNESQNQLNNKGSSALGSKKGSVFSGSTNKKGQANESQKTVGEGANTASGVLGENSQQEGGDGLAEGEEGEQKEEEPKFLPNDYMEKAEMSPPQDPYAAETMHADLELTSEKLLEILEKSIKKTMQWLITEKRTTNQKILAEGKDLQDKSVEELDQNLRKQWPRKGRLEVEVFQERKAQITSHNKKYERHVRTCLEKFNLLQEQWGLLLDNISNGFKAFQEKHVKMKEGLPTGKNLAELQGFSRREKDANQIFEEQCQEFHDQLLDLGEFQLQNLVHQNGEMLRSCALFDNGGNYAEAEVQWYRTQMDDIDKLISESQEQRKVEIEKVVGDMDALKKDPTAEFSSEYKTSIEQLSAKEGLGKTFGQPRRLTQERLRSEMTKCETAQKGITEMLDRLEDLSHQALNDTFVSQLAIRDQDRDAAQKAAKEGGATEEEAKKEEDEQSSADDSNKDNTLSIEIRISLLSLIRSIRYFAVHLGGFKAELPEIDRISYREDAEEIELSESEKGSRDDQRKKTELAILGSIAVKDNPKDPYVKLPDAITEIEKMCKDLCQKLYTGENTKYLVGNDKIPEYLSTFLDRMKRQAEEFKISQVRQLRAAAQRLQDLCVDLPKSTFNFIRVYYTAKIDSGCNAVNSKFEEMKVGDKQTKEEHLRLFRPNLENPANKDATKELNATEQARTDAFVEAIDDTQLQLLDIEQDTSTAFYTSFLNNTRALIKLYDALIYKEHFIMLPGDEIVEKKHKNVKHLIAIEQNTDLSRRATRKFAGLGAPIFQVDFEARFQNQYGPTETEGSSIPDNTRPQSSLQDDDSFEKNELTAEVEIQNTAHHKAIIKSRNDNYVTFKERFEKSLSEIMAKYDNERLEEVRFQEYWTQNLSEITVKHI